jgi:hypothetical protein
VLQRKEIASYAWVEPADVAERSVPRLARRITAALGCAVENGTSVIERPC